MERATKVNGIMDRRAAKEFLSTLMAIHTKVNGIEIEPTVKELTLMRMAVGMKDNGRMNSSMAKVTRHGSKVPAMKESM